MGDMVLCRVTRADAEELMLAPAVAGGWVDTTSEEVMTDVLELPGFAPSLIALLPDYMHARLAERAPRVTRSEAESVVARLEQWARLDGSAESARSAAQIRGALER